MENTKECSLPPIFKFPLLSNIFPYYGMLPKWFWLLNQLSKATTEVWNKNEKMFMCCGVRYKDEKDIEFTKFDNKIIQFFEQRRMFYKCFYITSDCLKYLIGSYIHKKSPKIKFLLDKSDKGEYDFTLRVVDPDTIAEYIPALNWHQFEPKYLSFSNTSSLGVLVRLIKMYINKEALILSDGVLECVTSPFLRFEYQGEENERLQIERLKEWTTFRCWWHPTSLLTNFLFINYTMKDKLNLVSKFESIKEIRVCNSEDIQITDIESFGEFLLFMKRNKRIQLFHRNFSLKATDTDSIEIWVSTRNIMFVTNKGAIPTRFEFNNFQINGTMKGVLMINGEELIAIQLFQISSDVMKLQYDFGLDLSSSEHFKNISKMCKSDSEVCAFIRTKDIKQIELKFPYTASVLLNSKYYSHIKIILNWEKYDTNELTYCLKLIPRDSNLVLSNYFLMETWIFEYIIIEFWKTVTEFSNITFFWKDGRNVKILKIKGYFDLQNLRKNKFKTIIEEKELILNYQTLLKIILD